MPASAQDINKLIQQAQAGNAEAQFVLADAYRTGSGAPRTPALEMKWLIKSANNNYGKAEKTLAEIYQHGEGVPKNEAYALRLYFRAANHGDDYAQTVVGIDYKFGESGVSRDFHEAARWFQKAASQHNQEAQANLSEMFTAGLISASEANWQTFKGKTSTRHRNRKELSLPEVERGLQGGITNKRLKKIIEQFGVDFTLSDYIKNQLKNDGADADLLAAIGVAGITK